MHTCDDGGAFADDERAIWFTEYKDTLDYFNARLAAVGIVSPQVRSLFGGSSLGERAEVRESFNDPGDPVRLLVATDVAAEGLNLQTSCRYVVHYEVPWNPMRLEQRNGRVDRHGQARDVTAFHFASDEDEDTRFLDYVVRKVDQVRDDLGSVGDVIDRALEERFSVEDVPEAELERRIDQTLQHAAERLDLAEEDALRPEELGAGATEAMERTARELRIDPARLRRLLREACAVDRGKLEEAADGSNRLQTVPRGWERVVDGSLRLDSKGAVGALPRLVFDTEALLQTVGPRKLFRERPDVRLLRLAHPVMRRAASTLHRRLWQPGDDVRRFTIGACVGLDGPILVVPSVLTIVNELREPLHAELVELAFRVSDDVTVVDAPDGEPLPLDDGRLDGWHDWLEERWPDIAPRLEEHRQARQDELEAAALDRLPGLLAEAQEDQTTLYDRRIKELDADAGEKGLERRRREIAKLEQQMLQLTFDPEHRASQEDQLRQMRQELEEAEYRRVEERRARQRERLVRDRDRLVGETLPRRYSLARCTLLPVGAALLVPPSDG